ncbi:MAG: hypothetical protein ABIP05_03980, partial [Nitrospiraceae bacterium]
GLSRHGLLAEQKASLLEGAKQLLEREVINGAELKASMEQEECDVYVGGSSIGTSGHHDRSRPDRAVCRPLDTRPPTGS